MSDIYYNKIIKKIIIKEALNNVVDRKTYY